MKKVVFVLSCAICLGLLAGCSISEAPKDTDGQKEISSQAPSPTSSTAPVESFTPVSKPAPAPALESSGVLGDYSVDIKDSTLTKDYSGKPSIVITYTFTNNGEEAVSAMFALRDTAYQNGIQLESAIISDSAIYNAQNKMKDIKTGGTLDVQAAFLLDSETAPVELEISELISLSDEMLGKTFETSPGGVTALATIEVPTDAVVGKIGGFEVSIISCAVAKDYQEADAVVVTFGFKNNSDEPANFMTALSYPAYQDSVQLSSAIVSDAGVANSLMKSVKPGAALLVTAAYTTTGASPIEIEVEPLFSFSKSEKIARTFTMN